MKRWFGLLFVVLLLPVQAAGMTYVLHSQRAELLAVEEGTGRVLKTLKVSSDLAPHNMVTTTQGWLVVGSGKQITLIDPVSWQILAMVAIPPPIEPIELVGNEIPVLETLAEKMTLFGLGYAATNGLIYAGITTQSKEHYLYQLDPLTKQIRLMTQLKDIPQPRDLAMSADGLRLFVATIQLVPEPAAQVWVFNPYSGRGRSAVEFDPERPYLTLSPDSSRLFLLTGDNAILALNTLTLSPIRRYPVTTSPIHSIYPAQDNRRLWVTTTDQTLLWDTLGEIDTQRQGLLTASHNRYLTVIPKEEDLVLSTPTEAVPARPSLKRIAVIGFETPVPEDTALPDVADVITGDLLLTRQYEVIPPLQVNSVLAALELTPEQLQKSTNAIQQVMRGLGADVLLIGDKVKIDLPSHGLESVVSSLGAIFLGIPLPLGQLNNPQVRASAKAYNAQGSVFWKAEVTNFDPGFLQGKTDLLLINNGLSMTAHDLVNKFTDGRYNQVPNAPVMLDFPPLVKNTLGLSQIKRLAILGPDAELGRDGKSESLGARLAEQMRKVYPWEVLTPDQTRARLAQAGVETVQALAMQPRQLASLLGVDAVCFGMVRGSTTYTAGLISFGTGTTADVILQTKIMNQQGELLWQDIQVTQVPGFIKDERNLAAREAIEALMKRLQP